MLKLYKKIERDRWLPMVLAIVIIALLASCSKDQAITQDYKLYDLDGSNQVIIGNAGAIKVSDVTAYDFDGKKIAFETGIFASDVGKIITSELLNSCKYGYIDIRNKVVVTAKSGSMLNRVIREKLAASKKGVVARSCVARR